MFFHKALVKQEILSMDYYTSLKNKLAPNVLTKKDVHILLSWKKKLQNSMYRPIFKKYMCMTHVYRGEHLQGSQQTSRKF